MIPGSRTLYGISKVFGELMGDYYFHKLGLDVRGVRLPGIISWKTEPTAGTTDYAVAIFYGAIRDQSYTCYLERDTRLLNRIAAFGAGTPLDNTPNDTIQRPSTLYGISKVFGELMGDYYFHKLGLDVRGVRLPGIISWKTEPTAGTTDYAVAIFYGAIRDQSYTCYLEPDTRLPMMYMPDAILSLVKLAEADVAGLKHHSDFNVNSMSFTPTELYEAINARVPEFTMSYEIDPMRQAIADSWPNSLDDSAAREEWGWQPEYDLDAMVDDMLENLRKKLA